MIGKLLAIWAILPAAATFYFVLFWTHFDFWSKRRLLWMGMLGLTFAATAAIALVLRRWTFAGRFDLPVLVAVIGWVLFAAVGVFGTIADRQIGFRVRSFAPFFGRTGRITLQTTGAYGVVRHPIYAAGSWFQLAIFLVTGYPSVLIAWAIFTFGAFWFTKREEEQLVRLLDDPSEYDRYRARVPALFPRLARSSSR